MKKFAEFLLTTLLATILFMACSEDSIVTPNITDPVVKPTKLTIINSSFVGIFFVKWMDGSGSFKYFGNDQVLSATGSYYDGIASGNSFSREVEPGTSQLYFWFNLLGNNYIKKTVEYITVAKGEEITFTFDDYTTYTSY